MEKLKYSYVFVVLTYRNTEDLADFFRSNNLSSSKTIVVNSFYDDKSEDEMKQIALRNNADFISVPNKGYGAGNNRGIEYALDHYDFDFLIISNADITIRSLNPDDLSDSVVTAPKILTLSGKNQNPSSTFAPLRFFDTIQYRIYSGNHNHLIWFFWAFSRLKKIIFYSLQGIRKKIFAPHGAFIIFPGHLLRKCAPLFNERMFLFNEESHLGRLLKDRDVTVEYNPRIIIDHKEDGSVSLLNKNLFNLQRDSFIELYKYWYQ